ncbi:MAG TPA: glycoside hydrolase family 97 protein [Cyclobacteriaceae bacterium]|nr:glycoside hydrolase family 97 protein [Cyclobacteriaceae bacterium]
MKVILFIAIFSTIVCTGCDPEQSILASPDGKISIAFQLDGQSPKYSVSFNGFWIIRDSELSLEFAEEGAIRENLKLSGSEFRDGKESYSLVAGKTDTVNDPYREAIFHLRDNSSPDRRIDLIFRIFNDGIAIRYELPSGLNDDSVSITDERTLFRIQGNPKITALFLPSFNTSHEGEYHTLPMSMIKEDTLMDMPVLVEFDGPVFMSITEAALRNYSGMSLAKGNDYLISRLSPLPCQDKIKVKAGLPHHTPWRVMLIGDQIRTLIESNILTSLNDPCRIEDISWIKPGKTTWPWWNGNIVGESVKNPGNNFETNKYYIDFCARNGIEYHSVVEYGGHEWYMNDGHDFQPGLHADVTTPVPGLDIQQICDYGSQKGVGIRLWVHWAALYPKLDEAFALYEKWGIKGLMVDFMDRDDQEMVNIQEEILVKTARHKLHIQFHGSHKPTGLSRTFPNELTREGVMNYEYNKWGRVTPDHDLIIPFTRMVAGSTDYHLGGFRATTPDSFQAQYIRPQVIGTRCHMMAMYVVLENYLNMVADYPAVYEGTAGFEFITDVPTTWDETRVLEANVGKFISIARKKGNEWYVGAIANHESRSLLIPFGFLDEGNFEAEIYRDSDKSGIDPNALQKQILPVTENDSLEFALAPGGGLAMKIIRK